MKKFFSRTDVLLFTNATDAELRHLNDHGLAVPRTSTAEGRVEYGFGDFLEAFVLLDCLRARKEVGRIGSLQTLAVGLRHMLAELPALDDTIITLAGSTVGAVPEQYVRSLKPTRGQRLYKVREILERVNAHWPDTEVGNGRG